ncbi:phosphatase PAP2 family protein [Sphingomonas glacialis]|uniref:Phosphatase PAP2 family protein n=1 Tax=Sphingomonas glacialis TaxID=658225 RepID=A0ABQ3LJI6_9SPHN|nr:phosphatase PAP2 family protein [Sphingomonas glacialis]GHH18132.1 phosphatase PAP2 family protein [Sphingomonas glacialis]
MPPPAPDVRHPPWTIVAVAALTGAGGALLLLGALIDRGLQFGFDRAILLWARGGVAHGVPPGPAWLTQSVVDVTALGGPTVLVLVAALAAGLLIVQRHWLTLALVLGGTISGSIVVTLVKALVGRTRPTVTDHLVSVYNASFPSGHAANSACVYLTLALLLLQITEHRALRRYVLGAALLLVTAIGCSRVYLGVHWPSDVLAGWTFGGLWAVAWWSLGAALRLRIARRRTAA